MTKHRITRHFINRAKKRAGLNRKATIKFYNKAIVCGLKAESFKSRPLFFKYLNKIARYNYHTIVYNRYILICSDIDDIAITLLNLPKEYYSLVDSIRKIKKGIKDNDIEKYSNDKRCN